MIIGQPCRHIPIGAYASVTEEVGHALSAAKNNLLFSVYYDYYYSDV